MALIEVDRAVTGYGKTTVLEQVDFAVDAGSVVGLVGRNGAGKTTLLSMLMGLLPVRAGHYRLDGADVAGRPPHWLCRQGLAFVPADRQVFGELSVEANLRLAAFSGRTGPWDLARAYALFPRLQERRDALAINLSGGERQMLAIARGALANPLLLLLDEPTEGLAPLMVAEVVRAIRQIRDEGTAIVVVEQNLHAILDLLTHACVLEIGRVVWNGTRAQLDGDMNSVSATLGI